MKMNTKLLVITQGDWAFCMGVNRFANNSNQEAETCCTFRVQQGVPQLWDPVTAETRPCRSLLIATGQHPTFLV